MVSNLGDIDCLQARHLREEARMQADGRIESALKAALAAGENHGTPPRLAAAVRHAVFPGGARVRPKLCLAVAAACGDDDPALADGAGAAIELLHCASLTHDDLPCFDDAATRRGLPSVHAAYGERCAVLAGDALVVMAFETLARAAARSPMRLPGMIAVLATRTGMPQGVIAGQAWECEDWVALPDYQRAKTGSLFAAAAELGALAAGADPAPWRTFGESLGEAYQVADDIRDVAAEAHWLGKPVGRDVCLGRPSAVTELGMAGALEHFESLVRRAAEAVPEGPRSRGLRALLAAEAERLLPVTVRSRAAPMAA
jgi:geranylgeranyl diphosphate synthase type II